MPVGCKPHIDPLGVSFGGEAVFQDGRVRDIVRVYLGRSDRVVAVARSIYTQGVDLDLKSGAIDRFGSPLLNTSSNVVYWPMSAEALVSAEEDKTFRTRCFPSRLVVRSSSKAVDGRGKVNISVLETQPFQLACGQLMGAAFNDGLTSFYLVDTDHIAGIRAQAQEVKETETQSLESAIEF